jgi:hypothetical protein
MPGPMAQKLPASLTHDLSSSSEQIIRNDQAEFDNSFRDY